MLKKRVSVNALVIASVMALIIGFVLASRLEMTPTSQAVEHQGPSAVSGVSTPPSFVDLARELEPTVVNISTSHIVDTRQHHEFRSPFDGNDPFNDFFRFFGPPQGKFEQRALGSGVIISKDGYILTNNHVVEKADEISIVLSDSESDSETYVAEVIGTDPKTDLALIKIDANHALQVAPLGDSDELQVGEWVIAIGNPFGFGQTVTAGIVSAKGRVIGATRYDDFIQTDASINPGNSGGALINTKGEVVGINTAIVSPSGGNVGIGFTIPINLAKDIYPQLREHGRVVRGWLGVGIQPVTGDLAESFGIESRKGALVNDVFKDSPAEEAGIKDGDVIVKFEDREVEDPQHLANIVAMTPVKTKAEVTIIRKGKKKEITVVLGEYPEDEELLADREETNLGLTVQDLNQELARKLDFDGDRGVVVTDVEPGSAAAKAKIQRWDVILEVNQTEISDVDNYRAVIEDVAEGDVILLWIWNGGFKRYATIKNPE
ncbi:DegQ family serine endoprotease [Thermodesulfobacteriota bacterium]